MTYENEFVAICGVLERSSSKNISAEDKEKLYRTYQTTEGRQNLLKVAAGMLEGEVGSGQTKPAAKHFFAKCSTFIGILFASYVWGLGLFFDGSRWWHHLAFIPLGLALCFLIYGIPALIGKAADAARKIVT